MEFYYYPSSDVTYKVGLSAFAGRTTNSDIYPVLADDDQGMMRSYDWESPFYHSPSKTGQIQGLITGISGLNSHHMMEPEELEFLNSRGFASMWMGMPLRGRETGFMRPLTDMADWFLTNKESPVHTWYPPNVPRYVIAHSTGDQIFLKLLNQPEKNKRISSLFYGAMHLAGYIDSAGGSLKSPEFNQNVWNWVKDNYQDSRPHERFLSRSYINLRASHEHFTRKGKNDGPTFGQINEVEICGRILAQDFNKESLSTMPHYFLFGENDPFACKNSMMALIEGTTAEHEVVSGTGHDPLTKEIREKYVGKIEDCIREARIIRADFQTFAEQARPAREPALRHPRRAEELSNSARLAL